MSHPRLPLLDPIAWRSMWVFAMFDLPMETPEHRRAYARFRKDLLNDGFAMMQFSGYFRHCASSEGAVAHICRMGSRVPAKGEVRFLTMTNAQFARIKVYAGKRRERPEAPRPSSNFFAPGHGSSMFFRALRQSDCSDA